MARLVAGDKRIELKDAEVVIGRGNDATLPIAEKQASRHHCKVLRAGKNWEVRDLESKNGTLVNGRKTDRAILRHGSTIQIGATSIRFESIDAPPPPSIAGFEIAEVVGQGGMGYVYRGRQTSLGRPVAVKVLAAPYANDPAYVERFQREARMMAELQHPHIVGVIDVGKAGPTHYLVMEFVDGESLQDRVESSGPLPEAEAAKAGADIAAALAFAAERKLVHRDIKPENVLLARTGGAKLCDLGIAKSLQSDAALTGPDVILGTALYISPEQAKGRPADGRSDLYQLGGTIYFALTGKPPYEGETTAAIIGQHMNAPVPDPRKFRDVSVGFAAVIAKLMAKDPDQRYASAAELAPELERIARGQAPLAGLGRKPVEAKQVVKKAARARRRNTVILLAASALIAVGGLGFAGAFVLKAWNKPEPPPVPPAAPPPKPVDHAAEEAEKQKKSFQAALDEWTKERAQVSPANTRSLLVSLQKRAKPFKGTPYEEAWQKQEEQLRADAESACLAVWEPIRRDIADRADRGLLLEAQGMIDRLPQEARSIDGPSASRAETQRLALEADVKKRLTEKRKLDRASFDAAAGSGDFARAWELTQGLEGAWTEGEIRAMRRDLLTKQLEALSAPPLTRAKQAAAEQAMRGLQEKFMADAELVQLIEAAVRRLEADHAKQVSKLEAAHRDAYRKVQPRIRALGKERKFYEMRLALLPVLLPERKPETEPFWETIPADLAFLSGARGVSVSDKTFAAKIEAAHAKFAAGSAFAEALADFRDALLMEQLCLSAVAGFLKLSPEDYPSLEQGVLKHATLLDIERVEPKDQESAIVLSIVIHQGDNTGNPLKFYLSPVKNPGTLSAADISRAAEKGGLADVQVPLGLLYVYAGDPKGRELLQQTKDKLAARHLK